MDISPLSFIFILTKDALEILNKLGIDTSKAFRGKITSEKINLQDLSTILIKEGKPLDEIILLLNDKRDGILNEISELSKKIIEINSQIGYINDGIDRLKETSEKEGRYPEFIQWIDQHTLELSNRAYNSSFSQNDRNRHQPEEKEAYIWCIKSCIELTRDKLFSKKASDGSVLPIRMISEKIKFPRSAYLKSIELIKKEVDKNGSKIPVSEFKKLLDNIIQRIV